MTDSTNGSVTIVTPRARSCSTVSSTLDTVKQKMVIAGVGQTVGEVAVARDDDRHMQVRLGEHADKTRRIDIVTMQDLEREGELDIVIHRKDVFALKS